MTIRYTPDFIYSFKHKVHRDLPYKTLNILHLNRKIRAKLNDKDLKIFNRIYICSWNVNTIQPLFDLENLLKFQDDAPDICVFG